MHVYARARVVFFWWSKVLAAIFVIMKWNQAAVFFWASTELLFFHINIIYLEELKSDADL